MQEHDNRSMDFSIQQAMALAKTPAGQQLLAVLKKSGGEDARIAMEKAAAGELQEAKQAVSALLNNPEIRELLKQLGR